METKTAPPTNEKVGRGSSSSRDDHDIAHTSGVVEGPKPGIMSRLGLTPESFKRRKATDPHNNLSQILKTRHLHMIAIGGSIGAGLFVGSGGALRTGGPGALILGFGIMGIMIFNVVYALGELSMMYPVSGGFYIYATRFIDSSFGFALGWNYCMQWAIIVPLELVVAALTTRFWEATQPDALFITIFWVAIIVINLFGVRGYAEEEFWVGILKLGTLVVFIIMAVVFACGGGPSNGLYSSYWGMRLWYDPGAFADGFNGFCAVLVTAAFAYSGAELVGLAAAETKDPYRSLPGAIKQVFWRITIFYILGLFAVGMLVRYDDGRLIGSGSLLDVSASPFVIAAVNAGIPRFADFLNVVILFSVVSIGLSGVFGGSRTLLALSEQGYAPRVFNYVDRAGRPLIATGAILAFGGIAYISEASSAIVVFNWLLALSGQAALITWLSICVSHIRFRSAWAHQGHTEDELPFKALFGVWGSYLGAFLIVLVFIFQLYNSIIGFTLEGFFQTWLAILVIIAFYLIGIAMKGWGFKRVSQIDVDSGRRQHDWERIHADRRREASYGAFRRFWNKIF